MLKYELERTISVYKIFTFIVQATIFIILWQNTLTRLDLLMQFEETFVFIYHLTISIQYFFESYVYVFIYEITHNCRFYVTMKKYI